MCANIFQLQDIISFGEGTRLETRKDWAGLQEYFLGGGQGHSWRQSPPRRCVELC